MLSDTQYEEIVTNNSGRIYGNKKQEDFIFGYNFKNKSFLEKGLSIFFASAPTSNSNTSPDGDLNYYGCCMALTLELYQRLAGAKDKLSAINDMVKDINTLNQNLAVNLKTKQAQQYQHSFGGGKHVYSKHFGLIAKSYQGSSVNSEGLSQMQQYILQQKPNDFISIFYDVTKEIGSEFKASHVVSIYMYEGLSVFYNPDRKIAVFNDANNLVNFLQAYFSRNLRTEKKIHFVTYTPTDEINELFKKIEKHTENLPQDIANQLQLKLIMPYYLFLELGFYQSVFSEQCLKEDMIGKLSNARKAIENYMAKGAEHFRRNSRPEDHYTSFDRSTLSFYSNFISTLQQWVPYIKSNLQELLGKDDNYKDIYTDLLASMSSVELKIAATDLTSTNNDNIQNGYESKVKLIPT